MDNLMRHLTDISTDTERCSAFCVAYVALIRYLTFCDGIPFASDDVQYEECEALFLKNENLAPEIITSLKLLYADEKPMFFKMRKYLDAIPIDDLTVLKNFVEYLYAKSENVTKSEQTALGKFISYYDDRTDKWHWERSTEKWNKDMEALSSFAFSKEYCKQSGLKKALIFSSMVVGSVLLVGMEIALGKGVIGITSQFVPVNELSDRSLLLKLSKGMEQGESLSTRAHYIIEAYNRGLTIPKL